MIKRLLLVLVPVLLLLGLIVFSQFRHPPQRISGFIEADEIRLGSRVGGRVAEVLVQEGQRVERSQELVRLEPFDLLELEEEARANLAARQAEYDKMVAGLRPEEKEQAKARYDRFAAQLKLLQNGPRPQEIEAARGRLQVAEAELTMAKQNFERLSALAQQQAVANEEMDRAVERLKAAQAMFLVRQKELELLQLGTRAEEIEQAKAQLREAWEAWQLAEQGFRKEEIAQARAARDAAEAALKAIQQRKEELVIRSPIRGIVEALELQKGDLVAAGAPVLSIMDDSRLWVRAYVPQNRLNIKVGQQLWVTVDSYPGQRFAGELTFIARQAEFMPSNVQTPEERSKQVFRVKVELRQGLDQLRAGMAADVWLPPPAGPTPH